MTLRRCIEFLFVLVLAGLAFGVPSRFGGVTRSASQVESDSEAKLQSEQKSRAALTDKLSEAEAKIAELEDLSAKGQARTNDLQQMADQASAEARESKKQFAAERSAYSQVEAALQSEQVQAARDRAAGEDARRAFEAAAKDSEAKLQSAQLRNAALTDELSEAEAKITQTEDLSAKAQARTNDLQLMADHATAEAAELRKQAAAAERNANAQVEALLESEQAQALHDRSVDEDMRRSLEAAAKESEAKLLSEQKKSAALADKLSAAEAKIRQLKGRTAKPQARISDLPRAADRATAQAGDMRKHAEAERKASARIAARQKPYKDEAKSIRIDRRLGMTRAQPAQALGDVAVHRDDIGSTPGAGTAAGAARQDIGATVSSPGTEDEGYTAMDYSPYDTSDPPGEPVAGRR